MNCLLYARVSTDKQAQKELSIPAQLEAMKEYAKRQSWKVVDYFVDEGESARTANRPELKKLLEYCKEKKNVDVVLVHKIDRLARNLVDYATIKAILKQKGIRLVSVNEPFEDNPIGNLLENIIASISEWYSANLGEEVKKGYATKLRRGEWPHKPPIGYRSVREEGKSVKHVADPLTSQLVRQAFELYSTGNYSLEELAGEMAERGLKTKYNHPYSPQRMQTILSSPFYIGRFEWHGVEYHGVHEPIIEKELYYRVQETLKRRTTDNGEKGKLQFLLRGVLYCGTCGQKLTGEIHPRGTYYRCLSVPHKVACKEPYIPVKLLDSELEAIYERLIPPKKLLELLKIEIHQIADRRKRIAEGELGVIKRQIDDLENKEMKLADEMLGGKMGRDVYERMQKKYTGERHAAEARLSQLEVDYNDPLDFLDKAIVVSSSLLYLHQRFKFDERKNLLKAVFERIIVKDKSIVDLKLNPPFSFLLGDEIKKLFDNIPSSAHNSKIFEQLIRFTLSEEYEEVHKSFTEILNYATEEGGIFLLKGFLKRSTLNQRVFEKLERFSDSLSLP